MADQPGFESPWTIFELSPSVSRGGNTIVFLTIVVPRTQLNFNGQLLKAAEILEQVGTPLGIV